MIAYVLLLPKIYNYTFSPEGVKIVLFGRIVLLFLRIEGIRDVKIEPVGKIIFNFRRFFAVALGNRFQRKVLVLERKGWPRWWYLTPNNPEEALRTLSSSLSQRGNR